MLSNMHRKTVSYSLIHCFRICRIVMHWHSNYPFLTNRIMKPKKNMIFTQNKLIHTHRTLNAEKTKVETSLVTQDFFENIKDKSKETFIDLIHIYESKNVHRRGHVEFIYKALSKMEEFGVSQDLEVYKSLIDVLPKGKFIPTNLFQAEFQHYPKQQQCIVDLLDQMEDNGVMPDPEMEELLLNIFGKSGHAVRKYWRMMYWMPKFKNLSPWVLPNPVPNDSLELAKLALERMSTVDLQSKITVYETSDLKDSVDDTWIVSAQSQIQKELLESHPHDISIYVEGAFRIWLRNASVNYFILRADPKPLPKLDPIDTDDVSNFKIPLLEDKEDTNLIKRPSVHEQDDGTIFAMCATGSSSRDSLLSWIRHLEKDGNPALAEIPVLFTSISPLGSVIPINTDDDDGLNASREEEQIEKR